MKILVPTTEIANADMPNQTKDRRSRRGMKNETTTATHAMMPSVMNGCPKVAHDAAIERVAKQRSPSGLDFVVAGALLCGKNCASGGRYGFSIT